MSPEHFGDRLARAVAARESQVVLGLDPDPARVWPEALEAADIAGDARAAAVRSGVLRRSGDACCGETG